jgi:4-amino-4-deoxy-L-arabinose transferase-like glycosyltransferase
MLSFSKFPALLLLLLAAALLFFGRLGSPLLEPEEAVYAEVPREMAATGNWITPLRQGRPYYEKPPLLYWLIMAGYQTFGVHDWVARLIPCAAGFATILVTFWWGQRTLGFRAGLAGAFILCLSPRFVHHARMIMMDGLLGLWVTTALALGQKALERVNAKGPDPGRGGKLPSANLQFAICNLQFAISRALSWWLLSAAACGLGILTKGPIALALIVVPLFSWQLLNRRSQTEVSRPPISLWRSWLAYVAATGAVALPWYLILAWRDPAFLREFFWNHHIVMRFVQPLHPEPVWFYLPVLLLGMLPWTLLLPAFVSVVRDRSSFSLAASHRPLATILLQLLSCVWCCLFFSAAECKRGAYILPAMPPLALVLGYALGRVSVIRGPWLVAPVLPYGISLGVLALAIGSAIFALQADLIKPVRSLTMIMLAASGIAWLIYRARALFASSRRAWIACGLATFVLLFLAVHYFSPGYYRKYSMRAQVQAFLDASDHSQLPVVCYPHHWDSICFYLQRHDLRS